MDVALCIERLVPKAAYGGSLTAESIERLHRGDPEAAYRALRWADARAKPTWTEIEAVWPEVQAALAAEIEANRPVTRAEMDDLKGRIEKLEQER